MIEHPTPESIERYVIGAFDEIDREAIETHAASCADCTARLAREARLELALIAAAEDPSACPVCHRGCLEPRCGHCGAALEPHGYRTIAVLSQSPQGRVYVAQSPDGRRVALKELVFTQVPDLRVVESFEREGRVLRQLDHPCIPRYVDSFTDGEGVHMRFYLAQTYVEGDSLDELLHQHRFTTTEAYDLAAQVLDVLVYMQELSPAMIHRDLKPSNLIRQSDGTMVLVDFGSARERGGTVNATFAGTYGYAPAEQLAGIVDATSDVYALGMTLIHLLTHVAPGSVQGSVLDKANISAPLRSWLARTTAVDPRARFADARAARRALTVARTRPRVRWPAVSALAFATVGTGAAAWIAIHSGQPASVQREPPAQSAAATATMAPLDPKEAALDPKGAPQPASVVVASATTAAKAASARATPAPTSKASTGARAATPSSAALPSPAPKTTAAPDEPSPSPFDDCRTDPNQPSGYLTIATEPYSSIYWNGQLLGETPLAKVKLPPGCIEVEARRRGYPPVRRRLKVEPNRTLRYRFSLE